MAVARLYFETDAGEACPVEFGGPSDVLVYFLSLAFSTRYGSQHESDEARKKHGPATQRVSNGMGASTIIDAI